MTYGSLQLGVESGGGQSNSDAMVYHSGDSGAFESLGQVSSDFGTRNFDHDLYVNLQEIEHETVLKDVHEYLHGFDKSNIDIKEARRILLESPSPLPNVPSPSEQKSSSTTNSQARNSE